MAEKKRSASGSAKKSTASAPKRAVSKAAASGKAKPAPAKKSAPPSPKPRETYEFYYSVVAACVLLVLAFFSLLSALHVQAILIDWLGNLEGGLLGYGSVMVPLALAAVAIELLLRGRIRRLPWRITLTLLLPIWITAMLHTFMGTTPAVSTFGEMVVSLWSSGMTHTSGGVLGGLIAAGLVALVSQIGTVLILLIILFFSLLQLSGVTFASLLSTLAAHGEKAAKRHTKEAPAKQPDRSLQQAEPEKRPEPDQALSVDPSTGEVLDGPSLPRPSRLLKRRADIDVPLSDSDGPDTESASAPSKEEKRPGFLSFATKKAPEPAPIAVPSPDQVLARQLTPEPGSAPTPVASEPVVPITQQPKEPPVAVSTQPPVPDEDLYRTPPVDFLEKGRTNGKGAAAEELDKTQQQLSDTIHSFGVDAEIIGRTCGPSVTRFELRLEQGVKLSTVTNLSGDIALNLGAANVRIAPIPGRSSVVGIEVPNNRVSAVPLREVIDSDDFRNHKSHVAFAVGRDIANRNVIGDIARFPHVLVAGTTGSGKSVCINSMLISLLYKSSPKDVRLIMVDPKMVELGVYNGIPHLQIPVVTDPKKAAGALQWAVYEMMRRYKAFSEHAVRDISSYNEMAELEGDVEHMPYIVVVIDELADLMLVAKKEVEESICRVAQMGRAAGMHLVIATQRPSKDVITGLMKANIPSRIAFAVASSLDSRIILDQSGAEKLVGKGDMLFAPLGIDKPMRVQGCLVSEEEVSAVVGFIKENSTTNYDESVMAAVEEFSKDTGKSSKGASAMNVAFPDLDEGNSSSSEPPEEIDEMFTQAVDVILETGMASVSMLQRRLKLGYSRAARLVDQMEEKGIVGPFEGSKPRKVLISKEAWQEKKMQSGQTSFDDLETARILSTAADLESGFAATGGSEP
jgi:S-DNA-T family DNA segregation ATPase FtsK/SpoIIIE